MAVLVAAVVCVGAAGCGSSIAGAPQAPSVTAGATEKADPDAVW